MAVNLKGVMPEETVELPPEEAVEILPEETVGKRWEVR